MKLLISIFCILLIPKNMYAAMPAAAPVAAPKPMPIFQKNVLALLKKKIEEQDAKKKVEADQLSFDAVATIKNNWANMQDGPEREYWGEMVDAYELLNIAKMKELQKTQPPGKDIQINTQHFFIAATVIGQQVKRETYHPVLLSPMAVVRQSSFYKQITGTQDEDAD